ncbi:uncharacterized protein A1O9_03005 [Exophiala aquamarina CBS 119918]|uniref:Cutinase n=1 Tax=Exophiala aquamarina CBS 119918 TaxID=1182545 RepID=A0A072PMX9_9EURO|nr:uncharacterized protein A1O9_03005 [Exophiala aquamarina CBS 119918]KEF61439.1 hypothetical protein A1O9_03005 [Exophiala aquamarina CBS 119918]
MIFSPMIFVILSLLLAPSAVSQTCTPCDDVHFFLARGNNEPYPGRQGDLVAATCDGLANCGYENLIYSALFTDLSCQSTYDGTVAGHKQLTSYAERCPKSKLILAGYSQGGQIVADILGGGGGVSFNGCIQPSTPALDPNTSPGSRLSAVIIFGNTRHTKNQPYNFGNGSSYDGLFPRTDPAMLTGLDAYAGIMRDWCLEPDPICAGNKSDALVSTHLGYYDVYSGEAAAWIKSVASLTDNSDFQTVIPTSISGTVQDYATVGNFTPSGTVSTSATIAPVVECGSTTANGTKTSMTLSTTSKALSTTSGERSEATIVSTAPSSILTPTSADAAATTSSSGGTNAGSTSIPAINIGVVIFFALLVSIAA